MSTVNEAHLYYREGSSDKEYHATVEEKGKGFVVNFAYGRRGGTLATGTKTQKPVTREVAEKTFNKLVAEKEGKGYTKAEGGATYQHTDKEQRKTGFLPQLLNPVEEEEVEKYIQDDAYCAQEKHDGRRMALMYKEDAATGANRKGLSIGIPQVFEQELEGLEESSHESPFTLDGEGVGEHYYAFDLLEHDGEDQRQQPYSKRLARLTTFLRWLPTGSHIRCVETEFTTTDKRILYGQLKDAGREGIVFKRLDGVYKVGRPPSAGDQVKFKFYATASFVVNKVNDKRSIQLSLFKGKDVVETGNCTVSVKHEIPNLGDIVEVRYLYAYPQSNHVYQPVYLGVRDDIDVADCKLAQLKYKATNEEDEEDI